MFEGQITLNPAEHIGHKVVPIAGCLLYHKPDSQSIGLNQLSKGLWATPFNIYKNIA
jgi:hypothetical protein